MNTKSLGKDGSSRLMSNGISGVMWLKRKNVGSMNKSYDGMERGNFMVLW